MKNKSNIIHKIILTSAFVAGVSVSPSPDCLAGTGVCMSGCYAVLAYFGKISHEHAVTQLLADTPGTNWNLPPEQALRDNMRREIRGFLERNGPDAEILEHLLHNYRYVMDDREINEIVQNVIQDVRNAIARDRNAVIRPA